jgi:hypothetical protein
MQEGPVTVHLCDGCTFHKVVIAPKKSSLEISNRNCAKLEKMIEIAPHQPYYTPFWCPFLPRKEKVFK